MFRSPRDVNIAPVMRKESPTPVKTYYYACEFCDDACESETELYYHKKADHTKLINDSKKTLLNHICKICFTKHTSIEELIQHTKKSHLHSSEDARRVERDIFVCDICKAVFFNKIMLTAHLTVYHQQSNKRFRCPRCNKFIQPSNSYSHFLRHSMMEITCCQICYDTVKDLAVLKSHMKKHHPFLFCNICNKHVKAEAFNEHAEEHRAIQFPEEEVDCEKYFVSSHQQRRVTAACRLNPIRGLVLMDKLKVCILCREICGSKEEMKQHILHHKYYVETQPVEKSFTCFCGEKFSKNIFLKQHFLKRQGSPQPHVEVKDDLVVVIQYDEDNLADTTEGNTEDNTVETIEENIDSCMH